ncbi:Lysophospholipase, alpha-beta hydrolase superfamily [Sphingobium faniae]|nr:Lysophospholipase, alpha-beta hydrolase superfamily [Sphingobium faniae]
MRSVVIRSSVGEAIGAEQIYEIAATVYLPDAKRFPRPSRVLFAFPGGGYSRAYYDIWLSGYDDYSQAAHHVDNGVIVVACDHLGVGESSGEGAVPFGLEMIAAANAAAVTDILHRLETGCLVSDYPAQPDLAVFGIGHSMGGAILALMQWRYASFEGIILLGISAIENVLPQPTPELTKAARAYYAALAANSMGIATPLPKAPRIDYFYSFHWPDVPEPLITVEQAGSLTVRGVRPEWASVKIPRCGVEAMARGRITMAVANIEVPVFLGFGERDTSMLPQAEPGHYVRCRDISLRIYPEMSHTHNFAGTRFRLWDDIVHWMERFSLVERAERDVLCPEEIA